MLKDLIETGNLDCFSCKRGTHVLHVLHEGSRRPVRPHVPQGEDPTAQPNHPPGGETEDHRRHLHESE